MKKLAMLIVGALFVTHAAVADTGWNASYVFMNDGDGDTWYDLNDAFQPEIFDGADLGTFAQGGVLWLNSEINGFATEGDEFTNFTLWWRLGSSGTFTAQEQASLTNPSGDDYQGVTPGVDLLDGLAVGNYTVEVYASRSHTWDAGAGGPYTTYLNTTGDIGGGVDPGSTPPTGDFFTASFEVVPEPGTMGLLLLGLLGVAGLRRRIK